MTELDAKGLNNSAPRPRSPIPRGEGLADRLLEIIEADMQSSLPAEERERREELHREIKAAAQPGIARDNSWVENNYTISIDNDDKYKESISISPERKSKLKELVLSLESPSELYKRLSDSVNGSNDVSRAIDRLLDIVGTDLSSPTETAQLIDMLSDKIKAKANASKKITPTKNP